MAKLGRRAAPNPERREEFMRSARVMCNLQVRVAARRRVEYPDDGLKRAKADGGRAACAELKRLEAGGDAVVSGWEVGIAYGDDRYVLAGDGSLTPYESLVSPAIARTQQKEKRTNDRCIV